MRWATDEVERVRVGRGRVRPFEGGGLLKEVRVVGNRDRAAYSFR